MPCRESRTASDTAKQYLHLSTILCLLWSSRRGLVQKSYSCKWQSSLGFPVPCLIKAALLQKTRTWIWKANLNTSSNTLHLILLELTRSILSIIVAFSHMQLLTTLNLAHVPCQNNILDVLSKMKGISEISFVWWLFFFSVFTQNFQLHACFALSFYWTALHCNVDVCLCGQR